MSVNSFQLGANSSCACLFLIISMSLRHPRGGDRLNIRGGIRSLQQAGQLIIPAQQREPDPGVLTCSYSSHLRLKHCTFFPPSSLNLDCLQAKLNLLFLSCVCVCVLCGRFKFEPQTESSCVYVCVSKRVCLHNETFIRISL